MEDPSEAKDFKSALSSHKASWYWTVMLVDLSTSV